MLDAVILGAGLGLIVTGIILLHDSYRHRSDRTTVHRHDDDRPAD